MTYVSKKEKVFDLLDQDEGSSTSLIKGSDHRLKIFPSVCEKGSNGLDEYHKMCGFLNGKETNGARTAGFKYIPVDVLLTILMSEKDACIRELLERQEKCTCGERLFKANQFEDSEDDKEALIRKDAEVVSLKNRNAMLESELDECKDTLRKAMHKLENVQDILNENIYLNDKIKLAEETINLLEENKKKLELELENYKNKESFQQEVDVIRAFNVECDSNALEELYNERSNLKKHFEILQKELFQARASLEEMDILKTQSENLLLNVKDLTRENECHRKKLEGMKKLERCVDDLRKQAVNLAEKYKRECNMVQEQEQLLLSRKELQILRQEKEELEKKVINLSRFESEYFSMKNKLSQVEIIIDENEELNSKLTHLNMLQSENEGLKSEIERLKVVESEYNEAKEGIANLQRELTAQDEEIKTLTSKIKYLSKRQHDGEKEFNRIKSELVKKTDIIRQNEKQLQEIPVLQSKIEKLRGKLQTCMDEYKKKTKQLEDDLEAFKLKCQGLEESSIKVKNECTYIGMPYEEKVNIDQFLVVQELIPETCPIIELSNGTNENDNRKEIKSEKSRFTTFSNMNNVQENSVGESLRESNKKQINLQDLDEILERTEKLKELCSMKDERILTLEHEIKELNHKLANCTGCQDLRNQSTLLQNEIIKLQGINKEMRNQLSRKLDEKLRIEGLENTLEIQKKEIDFFKREIRNIEEKLFSEVINKKYVIILSELLKEEYLLSKKERFVSYLTDTEDLKNEIDILKKLTNELKHENEMLHKMKLFTEYTGKKALENVLKKLRSELLVLQNLSKPKLEAECQNLQAEVKRLVEEADNLKTALDTERKSKDHLEKEIGIIQKELNYVTNEKMKLSLASKKEDVATITEIPDEAAEIQKTLHDIKILKEENNDFVQNINLLQTQCRDFQEEVSILHNKINNLQIRSEEEKYASNLQKEEINVLNQKIKDYEKEITGLKAINEEFQQKSIALREELTAKEAEVEKTKVELVDMKTEIRKLNSDIIVLQNKLDDTEDTTKSDVTSEKSAHDMILNVENEFEELRRKLESCQTAEEKSLVLRTKRDNLIVKVKCFESEVGFLKKKLIECDLMKSELEQLKAERKTFDNLQMNIESEEKLLSDICGLRDQLRLQQKEIDHTKCENTNLRDKLHEMAKQADIYKHLHLSTPLNYSENEIMETVTCNHPNILPWNENHTIRVDSSTSCEKIGDTISVEEFKLEIAKIESKHKVKVQKLKEGNAEKIKRLMGQYEKESKNRNKAYNENLNNIKSNYESDIKKLVEKHKSSILRLQNLHEDEVQELNTNYETQMEAMQTLNENVVNDLTSGAVEKCKLTEKYNKEIKDLELKFQKLLQEKEDQHLTEVTNLQQRLTRNVNDLKEMHKQGIDDLSRMYEENIAQLEEKHCKELKKCKRNNIKRTEIMRHKYEDLLTEERKKYEEQLQIMLNRLKIGQHGDQIQDEINFVHLKNKVKNDSEELMLFNKILQKIIAEGLESIHFNELMLIHSKTCFATENFLDQLNMRIESEGNLICEGCPHMSLLKENKEELLKKIFILENEMAIKQLETHEAIVNMERAEKCRIEELKTLLRNEREKNTELKFLLTSQTRAQTDLKIESYMSDRQASLHETNYMEKVKELEIEKAEKRSLEEELQKERNNSKRLVLMLENERQTFRCQRQKDSDYIEAMRMRLEEALSNEQIMESQLDHETKFRAKLQNELGSLQRSFNIITDQPSTSISLESKTVKDKKNLDQFESEKEEKLGKNKNRSDTSNIYIRKQSQF